LGQTLVVHRRVLLGRTRTSVGSDSGTFPTDRITNVRRPQLAGVAAPNAPIELLNSAGAVLGTTIAAADGSFTVRPDADLPLGRVALRARARDAAGNQGAPGATFNLTIGRPAAGDYDGDGKADLATFRPGPAATWTILQSAAGPRVQPFGTRVDIPVPADYDGDGRADLAVFRPTTAQWFLLQSTAGPRGQILGQPNDVPVPSPFRYRRPAAWP
jgi:hypothetical protein